jgi:hypothetical protein
MKLYVWKSPYGVSYGGSIAYAVAESEEDARALVIAAPVSEYGYDPERRGNNPDMDILGPPDRVCDLPYAEIYEWSE